MTALSPSKMFLEDGADDGQSFFDALRSSNPFIDNRVNGLSADAVDVDDIGREQFGRVTTHASEACALRRGLGAMLWGEAGVGKSHLLSRLMRWAEHNGQAVAVYLHNLQAGPDNLPRSLLKSVVSILTRGRTQRFRWTPLFEMVRALLAEAMNHPTGEQPWSAVKSAYGRLIDRLAAEDASRAALADRTVYDVLYRFFYSAAHFREKHEDRDAALAVRWLSGDALDPAEARRLGLPPGRSADEAAALADNQQIKQVLVALSRAALGGNRPFLLCFDQVDNLDDDQAAALSRFLEALIDSAPNLLVVTAGIQATLLRWRETKVIQDSAWDRLAQFEVRLLRLSPEEGRRIVAARLEKVITPFVGLEPVRLTLQRDDLFPLGRPWAEDFFRQKIDWRPRDVIDGAREEWRREQEALRKAGGAVWLREWGRTGSTHGEQTEEWGEEQIRDAIDRKTDQKIADLRRGPEALPPDADNLAGLVAALVKQLGGLEVDLPPAGGKPPYHFVVRRPPDAQGTEVRTAVLCLVNGSAFSTTAALRRLAGAAPTVDRVILVTDERRPLAFGAQPDAKGRQLYEAMCRVDHGGFQHLELSFDQYAQLDALQAVVGMAQSGDLEIDLPAGTKRTVGEQEAIASHHRRGRYAASTLLRELSSPAR